ncbi:MAG: transcriptional regulator [Firmicutes bacterium]|nr:transcriptional regulator [Bacillota bacterium]
MVTESEKSGMRYIEKAIHSFSEMLASNQKDMMTDFNRANKGELFVLHFLALRNAEVLPSELSAALRSSTARISALLGALEKKGQIERDIDKSNRRNILVTITDAGRERIEVEMTKIRKTMTQIFTEMGETDTEAFIRLFKRFFIISQKYMVDCAEDENGCRNGWEEQ